MEQAVQTVPIKVTTHTQMEAAKEDASTQAGNPLEAKSAQTDSWIEESKIQQMFAAGKIELGSESLS